MMDIITLGAGSGGTGGVIGNRHGNGGKAGQWHSTVWTMIPGRKVTFTIGQGGSAGGPNSGAGGRTYARPDDRDWEVSSAGGASVSGSGGTYSGDSPGTYTFDGTKFTGGAKATLGKEGNSPGGGGAAGEGRLVDYDAGRRGARGQAWYRFRSA